MIYITIIISCVLGVILGLNLPTISYSYSGYLAIAIIAALDSVFGGISSSLKKNLMRCRRILNIHSQKWVKTYYQYFMKWLNGDLNI